MSYLFLFASQFLTTKPLALCAEYKSGSYFPWCTNAKPYLLLSVAVLFSIHIDSSILYPIPMPNPEAPCCVSVAAFPQPIAAQFTTVQLIGHSIPKPVASVYITITFSQSQFLSKLSLKPFPAVVYVLQLVSEPSIVKLLKSAFSRYVAFLPLLSPYSLK